MTKRIILFNGPPHSGKDLSATIAGAIIRKQPGLSIMHTKFAEPLKLAAHNLFGIMHSCEYYEAIKGNEWKDQPQPEFFGHTPREVYIYMSEHVLKKFGGPTSFGRIAARKIKNETVANIFLFSDSGFFDELLPLAQAYGNDNILLVELYRPGTSFDGDSRGYIGDTVKSDPRTKGVTVRKIYNDEDRDHLNLCIRGVLKSFFKWEDA